PKNLHFGKRTRFEDLKMRSRELKSPPKRKICLVFEKVRKGSESRRKPRSRTCVSGSHSTSRCPERGQFGVPCGDEERAYPHPPSQPSRRPKPMMARVSCVSSRPNAVPKAPQAVPKAVAVSCCVSSV